MAKYKLSVDQISDGLTVGCNKCTLLLTKEGTVYFTLIDVEEKLHTYCFRCIEGFLERYSENK